MDMKLALGLWLFGLGVSLYGAMLTEDEEGFWASLVFGGVMYLGALMVSSALTDLAKQR